MLLGSSNMAAMGADVRTRDSDGSTATHNVPANIRELLWEDKCRTLRDLIVHYRLPLAVKLKSGDISKYVPDSVSNTSVSKETNIAASSSQTSNGSSIGGNQMKLSSISDSTPASANIDPEGKVSARGNSGQDDFVLQIHETLRRKIIIARKMTWDKRQNEYIATGEQVEIPATVKGWLEVVPDDGRPVEYFDTIGGITSVNPRRFLVRTSTVGYQLTTEENGNSCWMPHEIRPGQVLTTGIVYMDNKKSKNVAQRNIFKRLLKQNKVKKEHDLKYLQCFDASGGEIMIPFIMSGIFSPIGDSSVANYDAVYEFQDLIMAFGLPVNAQLIQVSSKEKFRCPRGVIRLYGTREEEFAVVSKVGADGILFKNVPNSEKFEVPIDHEMLLSRGFVKTKTTVSSKSESANYTPWNEKAKGKIKLQDKEVRKKDNVREGFKIKQTNDQKPSSLTGDKTKPLTANYFSGYSSSFEAYRDDNRRKVDTPTTAADSDIPPLDHGKAGQLTTAAANEVQTYTSTLSHEPNAQAMSANETFAYLSSPEPNSAEQMPSTDVELPGKAPKQQRRLRSSSILEKLSVRKVKKERAKLKELRSDDVFSKRISRNELSYQEFFSGLDNDDQVPRNSDSEKSKQDDSGRGSSSGTYQSSSSSNSNGVYSTSTLNTPSTPSSKPTNDSVSVYRHRGSIQKRDLPPIPTDLPKDTPPASPTHSTNLSGESLYEHLPPAPQPPNYRRASESALLDDRYSESALLDDRYSQSALLDDRYIDNVFSHDRDDDGYMMPVQIQQESRYVKRSDVQLKQKSQGIANDSLRSARARKVRSELPREFVQRTRGYEQGCPLDIDTLFNFNSEELSKNRPLGSLAGPATVSTSQLYATPHAWRTALTGNTTNPDQRFIDNLNLESARPGHDSQYKSRHSKNVNVNPNATIRSHNFRKMRPNVKEIFPFTDSFANSPAVFQDFQNGYTQYSSGQHHTYTQNSRPQLHTSRSMDASMIMQQVQQHQDLQNFHGTAYAMHYVESEPSFRPNTRSLSSCGVTDVLCKQGDDSAISVCSRGEAGYPNESEFSYNVFRDKAGSIDDGWVPPDQIEGLSVQEVSKSLRYIGMKDRVVLRFANEQIDGSMLCTLDKKLLKEGFPELNALEVKKIMDFVQGWRPKKT